jgi:hypothetical protein
MPVTVVLAIGLDPWLFESQRTLWRSSGHFVTPAASITEGISHFRDGDFDAVLLGDLLSELSRERIISLIRSSGSTVPVLCLAEASANCEACEFAAPDSEPTAVMRRITGLLTNPPKKSAANAVPASTTGVFPVSWRSRALVNNRSGIKLRAQRAAQWEFDLEQLSLPELGDRACYTICFDAAKQGRAKGNGLSQPLINTSGQRAP